jgi:hypothetical protein
MKTNTVVGKAETLRRIMERGEAGSWKGKWM